MTNEQQFLLDVLKSFVHEKQCNFAQDINWEKLQLLATIHNVASVLSYAAISAPCEQTAPFLPALKKQCFAHIALYAQRAELAAQLIAKLDAAGIDHVLFKGYVVRDYYSIPELRTFGDIDILINPKDREKSHALMMQEGFSVKTNWEPVYTYYKDCELYELHTELMEIDVSDKADYKGYFNTAWQRTKPIDRHTFALEPEFHFIYLLTHIAKHIYGSGAGIRMYLDLALFIKHFDQDIDWTCVERELSELQLKDFANVALTVVEQYFGVKSPIALRDIAPDTFCSFMDYTMEGGVFGHYGRDSGLITLKKTEDTSRVSTIIHRLFPPASTIESRYSYLQEKPWLLPVAWGHRFIRTRESWGKHAKEAQSIIHTDAVQVQKLKQIYREIGL